MDKKNSEEETDCKILNIIIIALVILLIIPVMISYFVFNPNIFGNIPGSASEWFGFWASYSGTIATIVVAYQSWKSNERLTELNSLLDAEKERFFRTMTGINFRISQLFIKAEHIKQASQLNNCFVSGYDSPEDKYTMYRTILRFENISYTSIKQMKVESLKIGVGDPEKEIIFNPKGTECSEFRLQGNVPILEIQFAMPKGSAEEMIFSRFYFFYSQFSMSENRVVIDLNVCVELQEIIIDSKLQSKSETSKDKPQKLQMQIEAKMQPGIEQEYSSNNVKIEHYNISFL